jgi:hypothetical protein
MRGSTARYLGQLATLLGKPEAAAHFEHALAMNKRMNARPWLAHTQHDYAQLLLTCDGREDQQRATELITEANAIYHDLGITQRLQALSQ